MDIPSVTRVSLAPALRRPPGATPAPPCRPLLDERGAAVVLGGAPAGDAPAQPVVPSARTLFGPRGVCALSDGSLWVADTGHHRVLGWHRAPAHDDTPADWLLGQPAFDREGRNAHGPVGPTSLNVPTGLCACGPGGRGLAVADAWNHRVLLWHERPRHSHAPPDVVLGQDGFATAAANRGRDAPRADTLFWPYGVAWDGARLWVADTGNRRVLGWDDGLPQYHGEPAALVLGQPDFTHRDENAGRAPGPAGMRWPHALSFPDGGLCVADAGDNRLMLWRQRPRRALAPCDLVLGQADTDTVDHNRAVYHPDAASLNMPYGCVAAGAWLLAADTANSRLLAWRTADLLHHGAAAWALAAQPDWQAKGDNRWQPPARDSVCWPYALALQGDRLLVADAGNNRVLLWPLHATLGLP